MREFGRARETAGHVIEAPLQGGAPATQRLYADCKLRGGGRRRQGRECLLQLLVLDGNFRAMLPMILRHPLQQFGERGHSMACGFRKIGAAEERLLLVGRQEHGEWPARRSHA